MLRRVRDAGKRLLELADRPAQSLDQERDTLAPAFYSDGLGVKLAGGVAVVLAALFQLLADEAAVVRFVLVHLAQHLPLGAVARPVVEEDDQRLRSRALRLEHAVEEVVQLGVSEDGRTRNPVPGC